MGLLARLSLFYFILMDHSFATVEVSSLNLQYIIPVKTSIQLRLAVFPGKFVVRAKNMQIKNRNMWGTILSHHKGLLYHNEKESVYAEGFTESEFRNEVEGSQFSKVHFVWRLFFSIALAQNGNSCENANSRLGNLSDLNQALKFSDLTSIVKNCDFSVTQIFEDQIKSVQNIAGNIYDGKIWSQLSNAVNTLKEIIPAIYDKLVVPIRELFSEAPALANSLICDFTQKKVGGIALTALTGGAGLSSMLVKTSLEINDLYGKVSVLRKNKKALEMVKQLSRNGGLDKETIDRILKMENDLPDSHKNLNVRFRTDENLLKHFERHKDEMGFKTAEEYQDAAKRFVKEPGNPDTVAYRLPNGDFNKANFSTGEMVVTNQYGNIITYFKLSCRTEQERLLFVLYSKEAASKGICRDR